MILKMRKTWDKSSTENQSTHFVFDNFFFRKSCRLWANVEKYGTAGEAKEDTLKVCIHRNRGYANALQCYVTCKLPASVTFNILFWNGPAYRSTCSDSLRDRRSGIKSRWRPDFPHPSRTILRPTQPPVQWVPGLIPRGKAAVAWC
jgi:hypothetical protein